MGRCKPLGLLNSFLSCEPQLSGAKSCFFFKNIYIFKILFIYFRQCWVFVAAQVFLWLKGAGGHSLAAVHRPLIVVVSPASEHGLLGSPAPGVAA